MDNTNIDALTKTWAKDQDRTALLGRARMGDADALALVASLARTDRVAARIAKGMRTYDAKVMTAGLEGSTIDFGRRGAVLLRVTDKLATDGITERGPARESMRATLREWRDDAVAAEAAQ